MRNKHVFMRFCKGITLVILFSMIGLSPSNADTRLGSAPRDFWRPQLGDTYQLQLTSTLATHFEADIFEVDLFDTSYKQIKSLKLSGRRVICYIAGGSAEKWRPDFSKFRLTDLGRPVIGHGEEYWLNTNTTNVRKVILARFDLASAKGCDGVDVGRLRGYTVRSGFPLSQSTQIDFNSFLARSAHAHGLSVGLHNDVAQTRALARYFDFAVNERCHENNLCSAYKPFIDTDKPVFNIEYSSRYLLNIGGAFDNLCRTALLEQMQTAVLPTSLSGAFRFGCEEHLPR